MGALNAAGDGMIASLSIGRMKRRPPRRVSPDLREPLPTIGYDYLAPARPVTAGWPGVRKERGLVLR